NDLAAAVAHRVLEVDEVAREHLEGLEQAQLLVVGAAELDRGAPAPGARDAPAPEVPEDEVVDERRPARVREVGPEADADAVHHLVEVDLARDLRLGERA